MIFIDIKSALWPLDRLILAAVFLLGTSITPFAEVCTRNAIGTEDYRQIRSVICKEDWTQIQQTAKNIRGAINIDIQDTEDGVQGRAFLRLLNRFESGEDISPVEISNILSSKEASLLRLGLRVGATMASFERQHIKMWCETRLSLIKNLTPSNPSPIASIEFALRCAD